MKKQLMALAVSGTLLCGVAQAEIRFTGYASLTAGKVLSGDGVPQFGVPPTFLADYPIVSAYDEEWSFKPESLFGLQMQADLGDGVSATAQIVSRGADDFEATFEWAYLSIQMNEHWTLQAGKKRLPLFYYSDFYDVGYAYVWMRPPADTYTWQIFNYNGVNALYNGTWGDWSVSGNIYAGREDDSDNRLLGQFFFLETTREIWKDIIGGVLNLSNDWLEVRMTHMQYTNERFIGGERQFWNGSPERDGKFYGLSINADWGQFFVLSELNRLDLDGDSTFDSAMLTLGYRVNEFTPYVGYSQFETDDAVDGEEHNTKFVGVRWDFHPSAAFKIQYDKVDDKSVSLAVAGDSDAISLGVDLVF